MLDDYLNWGNGVATGALVVTLIGVLLKPIAEDIWQGIKRYRLLVIGLLPTVVAFVLQRYVLSWLNGLDGESAVTVNQLKIALGTAVLSSSLSLVSILILGYVSFMIATKVSGHGTTSPASSEPTVT